MLAYVYKMATGTFKGMTPDEVGGVFGEMLAQPGAMTFWMVVTVLLSFGICSLGLRNGVERITKLMMGFLFVILVVLCVRSITLKGAGAGLSFYLVVSALWLSLEAISARSGP